MMSRSAGSAVVGTSMAANSTTSSPSDRGRSMQREPVKVSPPDPAAREAWISDVGKLGAELLELAVDATAPKAHRKGSRTYLRRQLTRGCRSLTLHLAALSVNK